MSTQRTHYVTTTDGVIIGATVHGQGPPLVFVQGTAGDGDLDWNRTVEHLTDQFTCHLPSMRGRGLSGDHPDVSPSRLVDDILTYVDSIGEPIGLVAWSGSCDRALAAAARSDAVDGVAPFEPVMPQLMDEQLQAGLGEAMARAGRLAAEGKLPAAVRTFLGAFFGDEGTAVVEELGYFEATGRYLTHSGLRQPAISTVRARSDEGAGAPERAETYRHGASPHGAGMGRAITRPRRARYRRLGPHGQSAPAHKMWKANPSDSDAARRLGPTSFRDTAIPPPNRWAAARASTMAAERGRRSARWRF